MGIDTLGHTVLRSITVGRNLKVHLRTPVGIGIVLQNSIVGREIGHTHHPRVVRRIECRQTVEILVLGHDRISALRQLGIVLGLLPVLHYKVCTGLQAVNHTQIGRIFVRTLVVGDQLLGLVEILENKGPHRLIGSAGVVRKLRRRGLLGNDGHRTLLLVTNVGVLEHLGKIHVEECTHRIGYTGA